MNEKYKQKSDGQIIEDLCKDDRSKAVRLLQACQKRDHDRHLIPVLLGKAVFLVPQGTDIQQWKELKTRNLKEFRKN
jgi:hypothetical protein